MYRTVNIADLLVNCSGSQTPNENEREGERERERGGGNRERDLEEQCSPVTFMKFYCTMYFFAKS